MVNSHDYELNLKNFIKQIRNTFQCQEMLFVYGSVIPLAAPRFIGRKLMRKAQRAVDENSRSELSVKNAVWVETDDLQMRYNDYQTPLPKDDVHLGTYRQLDLGERFAKVVYDHLK